MIQTNPKNMILNNKEYNFCMTSSTRYTCKNNSQHSQLTNLYSKNVLPMLLLSYGTLFSKVLRILSLTYTNIDYGKLLEGTFSFLNLQTFWKHTSRNNCANVSNSQSQIHLVPLVARTLHTSSLIK